MDGLEGEIGDKKDNWDQSTTSNVFLLLNGFLAVPATWRNLIGKYEPIIFTFRQDDRPEKSDICYYLGVAYASNLGGAGTLTGTGTNLTFKGIWDTWVYSPFWIIFHRGQGSLQIKLCNFVDCSIFSFGRSVSSLQKNIFYLLQ